MGQSIIFCILGKLNLGRSLGKTVGLEGAEDDRFQIWPYDTSAQSVQNGVALSAELERNSGDAVCMLLIPGRLFTGTMGPQKMGNGTAGMVPPCATRWNLREPLRRLGFVGRILNSLNDGEKLG